MQIRSLNATFGRLERRTLELAPGLNIIEAPNEAPPQTRTFTLRGAAALCRAGWS